MKTISKLLLVVASISTIAFVSCRKEDNTKKVEEATFETPALAQAAVKVEFNTEGTGTAAAPVVTETVNGEEVQKVIKDIEFTESGYAIITKQIVKNNAGTTSHFTKGGDDVEEEVTVTTYTFSNGEYDVKGFAIVKVNEQTKTVEIIVKDASGNTVETVTATAATVSDSTPAEEGSTESNLCRAWTVDRIVVSVKGGQLGTNGVGAVLDAPVTMANVEKQLKDNGVKVPGNVNLSDYDIVDINFTQAGTFFINFTKASTFMGVYSLSKDNTFHYDLKGEGNYIFNASADGTVDFKKIEGTDYCLFKVNGKFESGNDKYTSTVELTLKEKK